MFDEPAMTLHYRAEGRQSYAVLLFVPAIAPYDLFDRDRKGHVKLYVRRVYITDDASCCRPICGSCAAWSTARICRSIFRAKCCRIIRRWHTCARPSPDGSFRNSSVGCKGDEGPGCKVRMRCSSEANKEHVQGTAKATTQKSDRDRGFL